MTETATFGGELRRLRNDAGFSLGRLAGRVHYSKGYLSKVENGVAQPNESLAAMCDDVLSTGGALTALLVSTGGSRRARRQGRSTAPFGLPPVTRYFTGRVAETAEILVALRDSASPCVLSGMAGVGKSALAVRCGRRMESHFPDGALFMDLRGNTPGVAAVPPADALDRFLRLLGVPGEAIPADADDRAVMYRDRMRGRAVLVVLDNARSAEQVVPLLPAEEKCRVLITSRYRLAALDDAHHVQVDVLNQAEGTDLLRSLLSGHPIEGADDEALLRDVVERCGRLPLAVRIAAARLRANPSLGLADLNRRLGDAENRLPELDDGERNVAAVFRLSITVMPPDQLELLGLLASHPGTDLDLPAAAATAGLPEQVTERLLGHLRDGHLIRQTESGRYHWHDLLRSFAVTEVASQLRNEKRVHALTRLIGTELHAADNADRLLAPTRYRQDVTFPTPPIPTRPMADSDGALAWFHAEWSNLIALCRVALDLGLPTYSWQLAFALRSYFFVSKLWDPWVESQRIALAAAEADGNGWAQATALNNLGVATIDRGLLDDAEGYYRRALARFGELNHEHGITTTNANLAWVDHYRGDHRSALSSMRTAFEQYRNANATRNAAITLRGIALVENALGEYDEAARHAQEAMDAFTELDLDVDISMTHNCLGWTYFLSHQYSAAEVSYAAALASCDASGSMFEAARAETGLGNIAGANGRLSDARQFWAAADARQVRLNPLMVAEEKARRALERSLSS